MTQVWAENVAPSVPHRRSSWRDGRSGAAIGYVFEVG
jgi:hypothetical protein